MKTRVLLVALLAILTICVITACGGDSDTDTTTAATTTAPTTTAATTTGAATTSPTTTGVVTTAPTTTDAPTTAEALIKELTDWSIFTKALAIKKPANKVPAATYTVWDGTTASGFAGGDGTKANPYLIANGAQLKYLEEQSNNGSTHFEGVYFALTQDIYLNSLTGHENWSVDNAPANNWKAIGNSSANYFAGSFDGRGHTIFGLYSVGNGFGGLFGRVHGTITTLGALTKESCTVAVENINVAYGFISGNASSSHYSAVLVAVANTGVRISNCVIDDTVTLYVRDSVSGAGAISAAAVGAYIEKCITSAKVIGAIMVTDTGDGTFTVSTNAYVGGLAGRLWGFAVECANFGDVYVGSTGGAFIGILGANSMGGVVQDCFVGGKLFSSYSLIDAKYFKPVSVAGGVSSVSANVDCYPHDAISGTVVAVEILISEEDCGSLGYISGKHKQPCDVRNILIATDYYTQTFLTTPDTQYDYFHDLYGATLAEINAHR